MESFQVGRKRRKLMGKLFSMLDKGGQESLNTIELLVFAESLDAHAFFTSAW